MKQFKLQIEPYSDTPWSRIWEHVLEGDWGDPYPGDPEPILNEWLIENHGCYIGPDPDKLVLIFHSQEDLIAFKLTWM